MADTIKIGSLDISAFKVGSADCKVYLGDTLLYPQTPPTPTFKWLATYQDSHTESAQCDSSSAITENEINLTNLVSVEIGDCVTSIGDYAFNYCSSLTSIDIPSGVTSIGEGAFDSCEGLTSVDIPDSITSIGVGAFNNCISLTGVTIGSGVTNIVDIAFGNCFSLTSIDIPNSVTSVGDYTFYQCSGLTTCTIGSGVTSVGEGAFNSCTSLTSIDIPSGVTSIGDYAFYSCYSLTSITVNATTPPTLEMMSFESTNDCPIYVPAGSVSAYQSAWSNYASRIQAISSLHWVSYNAGDSVPSSTIYGVKLYTGLSNNHGINLDDPSNPSINIHFSYQTWSGEWTADIFGTPIDISGYFDGNNCYTILFSDLGYGGLSMNYPGPGWGQFEFDIDLYELS